MRVFAYMDKLMSFLMCLGAALAQLQTPSLPIRTVGTLAVPGATLTYETVGPAHETGEQPSSAGPLLLFISGANGDADTWRPISKVLSSSHPGLAVATYDRRGFSRSVLSTTEAQDYGHRLSTDADDARRLIEHLLSGGGIGNNNRPRYVLATSSGAIVAL
jgi:acetyltransferase/esterase